MPDKSMLAALNEQLATKQADAERIANSFKVDEKGRFTVSTEQHADYVTAVKDAEEVKTLIDAATTSATIGGYLAEPDGKPVAGGHFAQGPTDENGTEYKSLADLFIQSEAYQAFKASGYDRAPRTIHAALEGKSIYNFTGGTVTHQALGQAENLGLTEGMRRKMHIRDLFPKSSTNAAVLYGVRETGWVNNARQVNQRYAADGVSPATGADTDVWGNAPKSTIQLTPQMFPVAEIKHSLDAHKNILADEPRLRTFLNTRMLDGVKYAEDRDLLHSVGSGEQITGLYNTPGVQLYTGLATDGYSVQVRRAITKAQLAEYEPTGLVVSPTMWEEIEVEEDRQGRFRVSTSVAIGAVKQVWHLNVVQTTAMQDIDFIVGAFGMGAQLHDRENVSVSVSTEHANNYTEGVVTFLASERVAFEVGRPESLVIGTWTEPTPPTP